MSKFSPGVQLAPSIANEMRSKFRREGAVNYALEKEFFSFLEKKVMKCSFPHMSHYPHVFKGRSR